MLLGEQKRQEMRVAGDLGQGLPGVVRMSRIALQWVLVPGGADFSFTGGLPMGAGGSIAGGSIGDGAYTCSGHSVWFPVPTFIWVLSGVFMCDFTCDSSGRVRVPPLQTWFHHVVTVFHVARIPR